MKPFLEILEYRFTPATLPWVELSQEGAIPVVRFTPADLSNPVTIQPFGSGFTGKLTLAVGDVTGDGFQDVAVAPESGGGPHIRTIDGKTGAFIPGPAGSFMAFSPDFTGGVSLALADLNGDQIADFIVGPGPGGGPHVRCFDGATGTILLDQMVFAPDFRGGASVGAGDANGDGLAEIVVGAGPGGGPHVRVLDSFDGGIIREFFAFNTAFRGGVSLVVGNSIQGDSPFLAVAAGPGGGPHVAGWDLDSGELLFSFMAGNPESREGVELALVEGLDNSELMIWNGLSTSFYSPHQGTFVANDDLGGMSGKGLFFADNSRWDWLEGTKWYVPAGGLPAQFFDDIGTHEPALDQTLWQIIRADQGYFEGTCEAITSVTEFQPILFTFQGHVTPNGYIQIHFTLFPTNQLPTQTTITGRGQMRWINDQWSMEMQMVSPSSSGNLMHWAYMLEYRDGFNPPNPQQVPAPGDYRSEEFRWLAGTQWAITYANQLTGETSESLLRVDGFWSGYFWGESAGPESYFFMACVTPEGRVLFTDFRQGQAMETLLGHILPPSEGNTMVLRPVDGEPITARAKLIP